MFAACTRAGQECAYCALVSGDNVYALEISDKAVLSELDVRAGRKAKVTGNAGGDKIQVSKITAGKSSNRGSPILVETNTTAEIHSRINLS